MFSDDELREHHSATVAPGAKAPKPLSNAAANTDESRAVAQIQAAMLIAQRFPRNEVEALDRVLMAFTRPALAEAAVFDYSRGGSEVTGLTIRAAEAIAQRWGHIHMGVEELDQRDGVSTVRAFAFDAQTGTNDSRTFQVKHWRDTKRGGYKLEDSRDIYELVANLAARRKRACILTVIPVDVQEAVKEQVAITLKATVEVTPELVESMIERFAAYGVTKAQLEARAQRRMDAITPAAILSLKRIYNSIRDGMSNAADWFDVDTPPQGKEQAQAQPQAPVKPARGTAGLRERAEKAKAASATPAGTPPPTSPLTKEDVMRGIAAAATGEDFDLAADLLRGLDSEADRAECDVELRRRRAEVSDANSNHSG